MPQATIGRGNMLYDWLIQPSLTPTAVGGNTTAEQSFNIPGLQLGDFVDVNCNAAQTVGIGIVNVRVSANNTLAVQFVNSTAGSLTPTSGLYNINVSRLEGSQFPATAG